MKLAMLGLGRMGANMTRRLLRAGHECVVFDRNAAVAASLASEGAAAAFTLDELARALPQPRILWLMVPAGGVDELIAELRPHLAPGDIVIDGGNSNYRDTVRRAAALRAIGLHLVDAGTSGGIWGLEHGFCLMLGGEREVVDGLEPLLRTLAPGSQTVPSTPGVHLDPSVEHGYLYCGPSGAGHFVKMVHNGIEYGLMAAYAEGMNLLARARGSAPAQAEGEPNAPILAPDLKLADIAELWRRGSVVRSWLLDLAARALNADPELDNYSGRVADSGEGRWTIQAGIDAGVPLPVLAAALFSRFASRGESEFADKLLSALRHEFGGHREPPVRA